MSFRSNLRARSRDRPRRVAFPEATDPRTAEAVAEIVRDRLLHPLLVGAPDDVLAALTSAGGDPDAVTVVDPEAGAESHARILLDLRRKRGMSEDEANARVREPLLRAAMMVRRGQADGAVAGAIHTTAEVLRAALWCIGSAPGVSTVSSSSYMVVNDFRGHGSEVLTFSDAGVVTEPDARQLADIALAAARARPDVVGDSPRVAFLSYSTRGSAGGPSVERAREAVELFRRSAPAVPCDGELQADAALIPSVAERKAPSSPVAGRANVLVFPDLGAANIAYKLVQRLANATAVGPILQGLSRPMNDLSRGATPDDVVDVACVTSLMAE